MRLSLCFVRLSSYAETVLREIHDMADEVELFFASRDISKARQYCQTYGGSDPFVSYEEAMHDQSVEAVYFLTPHHLHLENAQMAARYSKHVLMEKSIAHTLNQSRDVMRAADQAGIRLMVAENYRFLPAVDRYKKIIAASETGALRLVQIQVERRSTFTD